jgi:hypothetical protein
MDEYLDQFMEDHINGGYGDILDRWRQSQWATIPGLRRRSVGSESLLSKGGRLRAGG